MFSQLDKGKILEVLVVGHPNSAETLITMVDFHQMEILLHLLIVLENNKEASLAATALIAITK